MKYIFMAISHQQSAVRKRTTFLKVGSFRQPVTLFILFCIAVALFQMTGCTVTFTQSDTLQLSISEPAAETMSIVAEFEAGEAESVAGDVTQKAGSACAGGACIIY